MTSYRHSCRPRYRRRSDRVSGNRMLGMAHGSSALYVLPVRVKDDPCFRVCFGAYATSKEAALAADLPRALRGKERIGSVEIAKVLP